MTLIRRPVALACALAASAAFVTSCGTSTGPDGTSAAPVPSSALAPSTSPPPSATATPTPTAAATTAAPEQTAPAAVPTARAATAAEVPAVTNPTNLKTAPAIAAGKGTPPSDLLVRDLVPGTGAAATATSTVSVQYIGSNFLDGKSFDSTWANNAGKPTSLSLGNVIPGFGAGIVGMKIGGRREIVIPPALGYGDQANGPITANETLVFVVDLTAVTQS